MAENYDWKRNFEIFIIFHIEKCAITFVMFNIYNIQTNNFREKAEKIVSQKNKIAKLYLQNYI